MKKLFFTATLACLSFASQAQWTLKHASSVIASDYVICHSVINNLVYLVGSPNGSNSYVYEYDPVGNTYTQKAAANTGFNNQVSFTLNGLMFLVTLGNQVTEAYDPVGNTWLTKDNTNSLNTAFLALYPPPNYGLVFNGSLFGFALNGKGYIGGLTVLDMNTNMQSVSPYVFVYDPVNNSYNVQTVPAIATLYNILNPAMFELNGKGYVVGSTTDPGTFGGGAGAFEFDPSGTFVSKAGWPSGHLGYSAFVLNNLAYLNVNNTCSDTTLVYAFDPIGNTWVASDPIVFSDSADLHLGFAVNGKGYLGYGFLYSTLCGLSGSHSRLYEYAAPSTGIAGGHPHPVADVYPNPAGSTITIRLAGGASGENRKFVLKNMMGEVVGEWVLPRGQDVLQADLTHIPAAVYVLCSGDHVLRKVMVSH